jgi:hypothetical protein
MKKLILNCAAICVCAFAAETAIDAQTRPQDENKTPEHSKSAGSVATRVPVVIVGSAARVTWATTKFTAKHVAGPVAKTLFIKATPEAAKLALKTSAKYLLPFATRLSLL